MEHPTMKKPLKCKPRIVKLSLAENEAIQEKANVYTKGNWSQFVRAAALAYEPPTEKDHGPDEAA